MKSRRPRDTNIPLHETLEEKHPMDEISHEFARMSSRYTKDTPNTLRDRTRHSAQAAQGATRISARLILKYFPKFYHFYKSLSKIKKINVLQM